MAIIDAEGLFGGERLAACSDEAKLYWPYIYSAANGYGRLELNLRVIQTKCFSHFKIKPTEDVLFRVIEEYAENFLLMIYEDYGVQWGQWDTSEKYLPRHKTASDKRSPTPSAEDRTEFQNGYIAWKSSKYQSSQRFRKVSASSQQSLRGVGAGVGEGVGEGKKQKLSQPPVGDRAKTPDPRHQEFKQAFRAYYLHKNPALEEIPWDGQEANQLSRFLKKNPGFTTEQWKTLLTHRARSPVPHAEQLSAWISRALNWTAGPTDAYGKQIAGGSNGKQRNFTDIADTSRGALELLAGMDTPAYLGGGSPQTGTVIGQIHEGAHGSTLATDAQRDR